LNIAAVIYFFQAQLMLVLHALEHTHTGVSLICSQNRLECISFFSNFWLLEWLVQPGDCLVWADAAFHYRYGALQAYHSTQVWPHTLWACFDNTKTGKF